MRLVIAHRPLPQVLHEYIVLDGRVWVLFLIWLTLALWAIFRLRSAA